MRDIKLFSLSKNVQTMPHSEDMWTANYLQVHTAERQGCCIELCNPQAILGTDGRAPFLSSLPFCRYVLLRVLSFYSSSSDKHVYYLFYRTCFYCHVHYRAVGSGWWSVAQIIPGLETLTHLTHLYENGGNKTRPNNLFRADVLCARAFLHL